MPRLGAVGIEYQHRRKWGVSGEGRLELSWVGHRWEVRPEEYGHGVP